MQSIEAPLYVAMGLCFVQNHLDLSVAVEGVHIRWLFITFQHQFHQILVLQDLLGHGDGCLHEGLCHLRARMGSSYYHHIIKPSSQCIIQYQSFIFTTLCIIHRVWLIIHNFIKSSHATQGLFCIGSCPVMLHVLLREGFSALSVQSDPSDYITI